MTVAILGFAQASAENEAIAAEAGRSLATAGHRLVAGNLTSTFLHAFRAAKEVGGETLAILEPSLAEIDHRYCDEVEILPSQDSKHQRLLALADAGLVIGGGPGTLKLVRGLVDIGKAVVAVEHTGGVTDHELPATVPTLSLADAVSRLTT